MTIRSSYLLLTLMLTLTLFAPTAVAARGRGKSSPFVMTPSGPIPKSVYYQDVISDPATLQRMRQQEQQYYDRATGTKKTGAPNAATRAQGSATKPTVPKRK